VLVNIQFLRFAAAMLVVVYHSSSHLRAAGVDQGIFFAVSEAIGFAGVDIFFVISGFIMAYTTPRSTGLSDSWQFMRRRIARIYSGYWPFFLMALALFSWINPALVESSGLMSSAILWPANQLLIAVSWTLVFEMFFYLLFSVLILGPTQHRTLILKTLMALVVAWSVYSQFVLHAYDPGHLETMSPAEYYMLSPYLAEFLAGALLATRLDKITLKPGWALLFAGIALFLLGGWLNNRFFDGQIEQGYFVFYRVLAFGTPSLLILLGLIHLEGSGFRAPLKFSLLAGGASYAIYLSHTLLLSLSQYLGFNHFAGSLGATNARWLFLAYAVLILILSIVHYRLLEKPLHRLFKKLLKIQ